MENFGLSPVSFGLVGLAIALFANGVHLLGAHPGEDGGEDVSAGKTVAIVGSVAGAVSLLFFTLWFIIGAPFATEDPQLVKVQLLFATLGGKFGLFWIGVATAQVFGWSFKPIGTVCLFLAVMHVIEMIILGSWGLTLHIILMEFVFASYVLVLLAFWALPYGRAGPKVVGTITVVSAFATLYLVYVAGGIVPTP